MSTRRRVAWAVAAVLAAGAVAGGVAYASGVMDDDSGAEERWEQAFMQAHQDEVAVSRSEAEATALAAFPGTVLESELERESGRFIWEVEIDGDGAVREITVDAQTGAVLTGVDDAEGEEDD